MGDTYIDAETGREVPALNQGQQQNYIPSGNYQGNDKADLLEKIRPDLVVEIMRNKLLGMRYDENTKQWTRVKALQEFALTEIGAEQIANLMLSVSTQNTSISLLKDREIKDRVMSLCKTAQYMLLENWKEYGIKRPSQLNFVHEIIFSNSLVILKQPENEGIRKLLSGTIQEQRVTHQQERETGGMLGMFRRKT